MKVARLWSGLTAAALVLVAGTAFSGKTTTAAAMLVDFNDTTQELFAYPDGEALTTYLNRHTTQYLSADLTAYEPPDPCIPVATAWNFTVAYDSTHHVKSRFVYQVLLGAMSRLRCKATVTAITTGTPLPLVTITPTAG